MRLKDKVIAVTGSTKGIGADIACVCAAEGAKIIVSGRSAACGEKIAEDIRAAGGRAAFVPCDMVRTEDCRRLIQQTVEIYGRIDGLINNAGIFPRVSLLDMHEDTLDAVLDVNLKGAFWCTQTALKQMVAQGAGSIVNIGSTHWRMGGEALAAYAMSKGALHTLTQHVAHHFCRRGIRCNWVTVGWVLSDGERELMRQEGHDMAYMNALLPHVMPSGQFQTGEDIAKACVFLLSDEAGQVTGTDIEVTGGFKPEGLPITDSTDVRKGEEH